jgi:ribose 5-phosphate isomerase B
MLTIGIASDHAGLNLKNYLIPWLIAKEYNVINFGTNSIDSVDYPDFVHPLANEIKKESLLMGILICGSGQGVSITANKYDYIRCALCWNHEIAALSRLHNNANVLALPARFINEEQAQQIVNTFLTTPFEGGRHNLRLNKIYPQIQ